MKVLRTTNFFVCVIFVASLFVLDHVQAWHAMPHMIVGAIARQNMSALAQSKIDYILGLWRGQYPKQSTLERACVWLDDIQSKDGAGTDVTRRFDFIQLFKNLHSANIPWNPEKVKLRGLDAHLPIYEQSALFLLDMAHKSLLMTTTSMKKFEDPYCKVPAVVPLVPSNPPGAVQLEEATGSADDAAEASHATAAGTSSSQSVPPPPASTRRLPTPYRPKNWREPVEIPAGVGSVLSLNLHLRIILHLMADMHQPLHVMLAFYKAFPSGDMWGNNVTMKMPDGTRTTLHRFWDSGAFLYTKSASDVTDEEILEQAKEIMRIYPMTRMYNHFIKPLLAPNYSNIANETYELGTTVVYRELNLAKLKYSDLPYTPSQAYIEEAQAVARQQLALAGYRLGHCLEVLATYLPYPGTPDVVEPI